MKLISLKEAKSQGLVRYFTGVPCKYGHIDERHVSSRACMECARVRALETQAKAKAADPVKFKEDKKASRLRRIDKGKVEKAAWNAEHPDKVKAMKQREYAKHKPAYRAHAKRGKLAKIDRTPAWADQYDIKGMYELAAVLSRSGVKYHVDHVIPLRGKRVSGLHVAENLRVIPWYQNLSKWNHFEEAA